MVMVGEMRDKNIAWHAYLQWALPDKETFAIDTPFPCPKQCTNLNNAHSWQSAAHRGTNSRPLSIWITGDCNNSQR